MLGLGKAEAVPWRGHGLLVLAELLEDVLDLLAGLFEVAAGLVALALGLQVFVAGRFAGLLLALAGQSTQLSGAQLGITVTSLVVGFIAEPSIATLLRGPLGLTGLPETAITGVAVTLALVIATAVQMIFGELVPKNWAIAQPLRLARAVAGPQRAFTTATRPLLRVLNGAANKILHLLGLEPAEELASARSPQELVSSWGVPSRRGR